MRNRNYAQSHPTVRISTKRFETSPYVDRYAGEDVVFGIYAGRMYPLSLGSDVVDDYWHLRRQAALFDVPERPLLVEGPEAERFLDRLFVCDVKTLASGRARYAIACDERGGVLMDGVLIRHAPDRFWYVQADGDILSWMRAHRGSADVNIADAGSWVMQIQGPRSLEILNAVCDSGAPDPFRYFGVATVEIGGQRVLITRTGWSGELGFEVYTSPQVDPVALWDHLTSVGGPLGLRVQGLDSLGVRRIEAGILDYGTDMDSSMTPYDAGLGRFVNLDSGDFIGRPKLADPNTSKQARLVGISCESATPVPGDVVRLPTGRQGRITVGAWSPHLGYGIGYVVLDAPPGEHSQAALGDQGHPAQLVRLPFYDPEGRIPRGLQVEASAP